MFIKSFLGGVAADELLKADLKLFSNEECAQGYKNEGSLMNGIVDSQLCAGSTEMKDACQVYQYQQNHVRLIYCHLIVNIS